MLRNYLSNSFVFEGTKWCQSTLYSKCLFNAKKGVGAICKYLVWTNSWNYVGALTALVWTVCWTYYIVITNFAYMNIHMHMYIFILFLFHAPHSGLFIFISTYRNMIHVLVKHTLFIFCCWNIDNKTNTLNFVCIHDDFRGLLFIFTFLILCQ